MYDKFEKREPFALLDTSKYPPEVAGRFNSFITTQFDDSLSVEMQMRSIIKWAIDNFKEMDQTYNDFTEYILNGNINPFIEMLNDLIEYMNYFISEIDNRLAENIGNILTIWLADGTLADIINEDVFDMKADKTFVDSEIERLEQKDENLTSQLAQLAFNVKEMPAPYELPVGNGLNDDTIGINNAISYAKSKGYNNIYIEPGTYMIDGSTSIVLQSNINIYMTPQTILKQISSNLTHAKILDFDGVENITVYGGVILGDRYTHYHESKDNPWKQWKSNTVFDVGDFVYSDKVGFIVLNSGQTDNNKPNTAALQIDQVISSGTLELKVVDLNIGEWNFGVSLRNSKNITFHDTKAMNFWGDGFYIGDLTHTVVTNTNIKMYNVLSDNNRRQGMSVTTVNGLYLENPVFSNTNGTGPEAGIDFEPNTNSDVLKNIDVKNMKLINNNSYGLNVYLQQWTGKHELDIFIDGLEVIGGSVNNIRNSTATINGEIRIGNFKHIGFESNSVQVSKKHDGGIFTLTNPIFIPSAYYNYSYIPYRAPIVIQMIDESDVGNINIINPSFNNQKKSPKLPLFLLAVPTPTTVTTERKFKDVIITQPLEVSGVVDPIIYFEEITEVENLIFENETTFKSSGGLYFTQKIATKYEFDNDSYNFLGLDLKSKGFNDFEIEVFNIGNASCQIKLPEGKPTSENETTLLLPPKSKNTILIKENETILFNG